MQYNAMQKKWEQRNQQNASTQDFVRLLCLLATNYCLATCHEPFEYFSSEVLVFPSWWAMACGQGPSVSLP